MRLGVKEGQPHEALEHLRSVLKSMRKGEIPLEDFIISKELHSLEPKSMSPHVAVCLRIKKTNPHAVPALGSKVQYVMCNDPRPDVSSKARSPDEVTDISMIDTDFYFNNQIINPLADLMSPLLEAAEGGSSSRESAEKRLRRMLTNEHGRQPTIYSCFGGSEPSGVAAATKKASSIIPTRPIQSFFNGDVEKRPHKDAVDGTVIDKRPLKKLKQSKLKF